MEEKEMKELKECTFRPKINKSNSYKSMRNNITKNNKLISYIINQKEFESAFDKLYYCDKKYKLSREMKIIDYEFILGKDNTFTPNLNIYKLTNKLDSNFEERQKEYLFKKI